MSTSTRCASSGVTRAPWSAARAIPIATSCIAGRAWDAARNQSPEATARATGAAFTAARSRAELESQHQPRASTEPGSGRRLRRREELRAPEALCERGWQVGGQRWNRDRQPADGEIRDKREQLPRKGERIRGKARGERGGRILPFVHPPGQRSSGRERHRRIRGDEGLP